MNLITRQIKPLLLRDLSMFPVLTLTGPRQAGKSTLLRSLLPNWRYVNLEDPSSQEFAHQDPVGFVRTYSDRVIFDEIQRVPKILSSLQVAVDADRRPGRFAVTGSHNLLLLEQVSQTLAGRTSVRNLLPFSYRELADHTLAPNSLDEAMFLGGYPPVHDLASKSQRDGERTWLDSYMQTYVERDVRMIRNVADLPMFQRFVRLCAGRVGQLLDMSGIGGDIGLSHNSVRDWINVLETGFIAFRLEPYFKNYAKRIIKSPKLYFFDTGLLCRCLDIRTPEDVAIHPFRGHIFENYCLAETIKAFHNHGERPAVFFWRDKSIEIDLLIQRSSSALDAVECKSGATALAEFLDAPQKFKGFAKDLDVTPKVVYGGDETQARSTGTIIGWRQFANSPLPDLSS
jgi:predicted AAA+ superfamily ATPase